MGKQDYVQSGVYLVCDKGTDIPTFVASPKSQKHHEGVAGTIKDNVPLVNIPSFKVCSIDGKPCVPVSPEWKGYPESPYFIDGAQPLVIASYCKCSKGGNIKIFETYEEAVAALKDYTDSRVDGIGWLDNAIGSALLSPVGGILNAVGKDDWVDSVGRGFRKGLKGTWNGIKALGEKDTWVGMGKMAGIAVVGYGGGPSFISPSEKLSQFDSVFGTDLGATHDAIGEAIKESADQKLINGTGNERAEFFGEATEMVLETAVGTKGAGAVVKGVSTAAKAAKATKLGAKLANALSAVKNVAKLKYSKNLQKIKGIFGKKPLKIPQGLTHAQFKNMRKFLNEKLKHLGDDIRVQGSRAKGTAKATSDIDIAILVDEKKFNEIIKKYFKEPNPGSAKERTMQHAQKTGKIQSGEVKLSKTRVELEGELGMDVDISVIKKGGPFDTPPYIPINP